MKYHQPVVLMGVFLQKQQADSRNSKRNHPQCVTIKSTPTRRLINVEYKFSREGFRKSMGSTNCKVANKRCSKLGKSQSKQAEVEMPGTHYGTSKRSYIVEELSGGSGEHSLVLSIGTPRCKHPHIFSNTISNSFESVKSTKLSQISYR